ncbi:MAG: class I SAM-dependent methyltransferase [Mycobacteriales bacterium]
MTAYAADPYGRALADGSSQLWMIDQAGRRSPLPVGRWRARPDPVDQMVIRACDGPTLDVGCGPGRIAAGLTARGVAALGVDVHPQAVRHASDRGAAALCRSVFDRLPGEGRWHTVILLDGNIGIGGDPIALLARCRTLIHRGGRIIVEADPRDIDDSSPVYLQAGRDVSARFPWARSGTSAIRRAAGAIGLVVECEIRVHGRVVLHLRVDDDEPTMLRAAEARTPQRVRR